MKLYRYMPYRFWKDAVRKGFAAQRVSAYEDIFEGVGQVGYNAGIAPTFYDRIYSVVCFNDPEMTQENDEMQLWSRYADKGRGVRISLTFPLGECKDSYMLDRVEYTNKISRFENDESIDAGVEFIRKSLFTKGESWIWEHEVRLAIFNKEKKGLVSLKDGVPEGDGKLLKFWYAKFLQPFIDGVDFGPRINSCSENDSVNAARMIADVNEIIEEGHKLDFGVMMCARDCRQIKRESFDVWLQLNKMAREISSSMQCS